MPGMLLSMVYMSVFITPTEAGVPITLFCRRGNTSRRHLSDGAVFPKGGTRCDTGRVFSVPDTIQGRQGTKFVLCRHALSLGQSWARGVLSNKMTPPQDESIVFHTSEGCK